MLHKVNIAGIAMDPASNTPIVLLADKDGEHVVPIWIGLLEATSIASALKDVNFDRPMTHDLFKNFINQLGYSVSKVEICDLKDNTYYAKIYFTSKENEFEMDARPSDAIAMALRYDASLYVDDSILQKASIGDKAAEMLDQSEEGKKWAEYLEGLDPDDFGKYKI